MRQTILFTAAAATLILACVAAWAVSETQARVAEAATVQVDTFEMMKNREADAFRAL